MKDWRQWMTRAQALWFSRNAKERRTILIASVLLVPVLFYALAWAPLAARVHHLARAVPRERLALVQMTQEARQLRDLKGRVHQAPAGTALLSLIQQQAQANHLGGALNQLSPQGAHKADLVLSKASFQSLVRFLITMQAQGVVVAHAELTPSGVGLVDGAVTLRGAA